MTSKLPPIWIGPSYRDGGIFRRRILVLGESTYGATPYKEAEDYYLNVSMPTEQIAKGCAAGNFQRGVFETFMTSEVRNSADHVRRFWESVIFFNYLLD